MPVEPRSYPRPLPNPEWLGKLSEAILEPELPIVDPHHHLWDHPGSRYLLDDLLANVNFGHNIVATVFIQCPESLGLHIISVAAETFIPPAHVERIFTRVPQAAQRLHVHIFKMRRGQTACQGVVVELRIMM